MVDDDEVVDVEVVFRVVRLSNVVKGFVRKERFDGYGIVVINEVFRKYNVSSPWLLVLSPTR